MISGDDALRLAAYERVHSSLDALAQLGPASQIIDRCPALAAGAADLDRVLLSRIDNGSLVVERAQLAPGGGDADGEPLDHPPQRLSYPLLECELLRRRQAALVTDVDASQPARHAFLEAMGWRAYVAAPVMVDGAAVGFLHGDRSAKRRPLAQLDADALEQFAAGFALVFERTVLRRRLRDQRRELRRISAWAEARTGELSDGAVGLSAEPVEEPEPRDRSAETVTEDGVATQLTAREIDVLRLMAEGRTNGDIARVLFLSEGTVKFHVKNILRKMQASNRGDASARYLRQTLNNGSASKTPTLR